LISAALWIEVAHEIAHEQQLCALLMHQKILHRQLAQAQKNTIKETREQAQKGPLFCFRTPWQGFLVVPLFTKRHATACTSS